MNRGFAAKIRPRKPSPVFQQSARLMKNREAVTDCSPGLKDFRPWECPLQGAVPGDTVVKSDRRNSWLCDLVRNHFLYA
jgi:hypothetical protein